MAICRSLAGSGTLRDGQNRNCLPRSATLRLRLLEETGKLVSRLGELIEEQRVREADGGGTLPKTVRQMRGYDDSDLAPSWVRGDEAMYRWRARPVTSSTRTQPQLALAA